MDQDVTVVLAAVAKAPSSLKGVWLTEEELVDSLIVPPSLNIRAVLQTHGPKRLRRAGLDFASVREVKGGETVRYHFMPKDGQPPSHHMSSRFERDQNTRDREAAGAVDVSSVMRAHRAKRTSFSENEAGEKHSRPRRSSSSGSSSSGVLDLRGAPAPLVGPIEPVGEPQLDEPPVTPASVDEAAVEATPARVIMEEVEWLLKRSGTGCVCHFPGG